jgi:polysaccharide biosynthesis/export protein
MRKFIFTIFLIPLFISNAAFSQENEQLVELLEALEEGGPISSSKSAMRPEDSGYRSFVENELQNIFTQIDALSEQDKEDITFNEVNQKRIELATQLCSKDERACFLIDEYRSYLSKQDVPTSVEELKLFGQEIFSGYSNDFNFYDSLPLKNNYLIKIGDMLKISAFGGFQFEDEILVDMTGSIVIRDIGKMDVAGLTFQEASLKLQETISNAFPGSEAIVSLSQIRSKQIFILGNVKTPGTYALNAFGSALNGLISAGGLEDNSSLRSIEVIRANKTIQTIDLYDLLIRGNVQSSDFILNDGDSVLVGGLKSSASIIGEVIRPAIYEINQNETLEDLIQFALGETPFADLSNISVERVLPSGEKTIINPIDIQKFAIQSGDLVTINSAEGQKINSISLTGAVRNVGEYSLDGKKSLGDIISIQQDLLGNTYTGFAVLKRLNFSSKSYRLITFTLTNQAALNNLNLYSGDQVFIFSKEDIQYSQSSEVYNYLSSRLSDSISQPANNDLLYRNLISEGNNLSNNTADNSAILSQTINSCLASLDVLTKSPISNLIEAKLELFPSNKKLNCTPLFQVNSELLPILLINSVPVAGNVRFPGLYPTSRDLNAMDLFNFAGGFLLSKLNTEPIFDVGIRSRGFGSFKFEELSTLTNITMLNLKLDESSTIASYVNLVGEFNNPGVYAVTKNTSLDELYERAGGLTESAYPLGGIFTRKSIQKIEARAFQRSKAELSEIMASAVASGYVKQNATDLVGLISLMTSLEDANPIGRLVTELNPIKIKNNIEDNIILEDGDTIYIPKIQTTITIVGQVLNPVTVPHKVGATFDDYLKLAGGLKKEADKSKIYAILPNGEALRRKRGIVLPVIPYLPFDRADILPGSTLVIPRKARPLDSLALVETITPVLANLSVTAASIAAISDN